MKTKHGSTLSLTDSFETDVPAGLWYPTGVDLKPDCSSFSTQSWTDWHTWPWSCVLDKWIKSHRLTCIILHAMSRFVDKL